MGVKKKERGRWVASGIPNMGLSLPARCLFVSPRQGVKRERMKAARVEGQEQARRRRREEEEEEGEWGGTTCVALFAGRDYAGTQKPCEEEGRGARAGGEGVRRLKSEQRAKWRWRVCQGVCHILYHEPSTLGPSRSYAHAPAPAQAPQDASFPHFSCTRLKIAAGRAAVFSRVLGSGCCFSPS